MADIIEVNGVRTWYEQHGAGAPLLLLHPGLVDARALDPHPRKALAAHFTVFTPERCGHGHTPDIDGPYQFDAFAAEAVASLERCCGNRRPSSVSAMAPSSPFWSYSAPDLARRPAVDRRPVPLRRTAGYPKQSTRRTSRRVHGRDVPAGVTPTAPTTSRWSPPRSRSYLEAPR